MKKPVYAIGHKNPDTDSICSPIAYAYLKRAISGEHIRPVRCGKLNLETKFVLSYFGLKAPPLIKNIADKKVILIDHNESGQVVEGIERAEVFEVIDHHRIGDIETDKPILFRVEPVGSTATIIAEMFFYHKVKIPKNIAGCLLSSILSDTVIFKSPTSTEKDELIAKKLAKLAGIKDIRAFGLELKKAKSSLKGMSGKQILFSDSKEFNFGSTKFLIGQVEVVHFGEFDSRKQEILSAMKDAYTDGNYSAVILMVTDILNEETKLLVFGAEDILKKLERIYGNPLKDNVIHVVGMVSRKKQVVPPLRKTFS